MVIVGLVYPPLRCLRPEAQPLPPHSLPPIPPPQPLKGDVGPELSAEIILKASVGNDG